MKIKVFKATTELELETDVNMWIREDAPAIEKMQTTTDNKFMIITFLYQEDPSAIAKRYHGIEV